MQIHQLSAADAVASLNSSPQGLSSAEAAAQARRVRPQSGGGSRRRIDAAAVSEGVHPLLRADPVARRGTRLSGGVERSGTGHGQGRLRGRGRSSWSAGSSPSGRNSGSSAPLPRCASCCRSRSTCCARARRSGWSADSLVPGEIVLLEEGNNIPADCRLIEAFGVRVNDATVTGESLSKLRTAEPSAAERNNSRREHPARRHFDGFGGGKGGGLCHRHAYGVRQDRSPGADRRAKPSLRCASRSRT